MPVASNLHRTVTAINDVIWRAVACCCASGSSPHFGVVGPSRLVPGGGRSNCLENSGKPPSAEITKPVCVTANSSLLCVDGAERPNEQAQCRRRHAQTLWDNDNPAAALRLQQQLLQSGQGDADQQQRDRARLETWRSELQERALTVFRDGDLEQAIALLSQLEQSRSPGASTLSDTMRETWNRNRLDHQQLQTLVEAERWWEALDRLNQLDHPWWKTHATPLRQTVETAIEQLRQTEEHRQHGSSNPDVISGDKLESSVQQQMQLGLDPWIFHRL